jgi:hypothetical protein
MFSNSAESSSSLGEDRQFIEWPKACHQKSDNCDENTMTTRVISSVELHMGRDFRRVGRCVPPKLGEWRRFIEAGGLTFSGFVRELVSVAMFQL